MISVFLHTQNLQPLERLDWRHVSKEDSAALDQNVKCHFLSYTVRQPPIDAKSNDKWFLAGLSLFV